MTKLDIAKKIIREHYLEADCGIYDSRNIVGDPMTNIYNDGDLTIDICYYYSYFEVFGLSNNEFRELASFYTALFDYALRYPEITNKEYVERIIDEINKIPN